MRHTLTRTSVVVVAIAAATFGQIPANGAAVAGCVVPGAAQLKQASVPLADGSLAHEQWIAGRGPQLALESVRARLVARFGENTKEQPFRQLAAGLIGTTVDHTTQQVVVVTDPAVASGGLQSELRGVSAAASRADLGTPQLGVRVQAGCHSAAALTDAAGVITGRSWHGRAAQATYGGYLDPDTATFAFTFDPADRDVAEALTARLGDRVRISYGGVARSDRADDSAPHWGGAAIGVDGDGIGAVCSSGFTVDTASAGKAMVTAGHCFNNGQVIESGDEPYGTAQGKSNYPAYDMMLINASTQDYDDDLYHDPYVAENSPIDVSGSGDPGVGASICISGMIHKSVCGNSVKALDAYMCSSLGCTYGLIRTERSGTDPCKPGTSGGPMYSTGPNHVRGLLIGYEYLTSDAAKTPVACFGERVSNVKSHLNVTVATSP